MDDATELAPQVLYRRLRDNTKLGNKIHYVGLISRKTLLPFSAKAEPFQDVSSHNYGKAHASSI
jgi:hypothetical protein